MILPSKYVNIRGSLLHQAGALLPLLDRSRGISNLWEAARRQGIFRSFDRFVLALDLLNALGLVVYDDETRNLKKVPR